MVHHTPLITMIVAGLVLAFVLGAIANRLKISPLVGYLLAGVLIGPATPGYTADLTIAHELAEIGVILLMFGVGLHFSVKDLLSVKAIAVPGAIGQIALATILGLGLAMLMGWTIGAGIIFGLALSTASTVVLLRAIQERRLIETKRGRIAVGWLIVEDMAMVLALVLIPALAQTFGGDGDGHVTASSGSGILTAIAITLAKVIGFIALMLVVGRRVIPWVLHLIAHTGSRELFRLAVLAIALGSAYGASVLFDVSFALGAFFGGLILSESPLSQRAAEESLPLRDAFAVLFFVSVGMLFDPATLFQDPLPVIATVLIIIFGKSIGAYFIVRAFGYPAHTAMTVSVSLAQIGEFSFILAGLGVALDILPVEGQAYILAGAILSILANPMLFAFLDRRKIIDEAPTPQKTPEAPVEVEPSTVLTASTLSNHMVVVGYGRVGQLVVDALKKEHQPLLVIEDSRQSLEPLRTEGIETIQGNAAGRDIIKAANLEAARCLFVAIPQAFEAGQIVAQARAANPNLHIVARAHADAEVEHLRKNGATTVIMGEREIARGMIADVFGKQASASMT